jgi:hypothetical protein
MSARSAARRLAVLSRRVRPRERLARVFDPRALPVGGPALGYLVTREMRLMAADAEQALGLARAAAGAVVEGVRAVAASSSPAGPAAPEPTDAPPPSVRIPAQRSASVAHGARSAAGRTEVDVATTVGQRQQVHDPG